jgi:hypothetical protein
LGCGVVSKETLYDDDIGMIGRGREERGGKGSLTISMCLVRDLETPRGVLAVGLDCDL